MLDDVCSTTTYKQTNKEYTNVTKFADLK